MANTVLSHNNGTLKSDPIKIKHGIFQEDSLSPLLFCLALIPLSNKLSNTGYEYKTFDRTINHLFSMDDLKLFAQNDQDLEGLLNTVKEFSNNIGMEFGLDKCAKVSFVRRKNSENIVNQPGYRHCNQRSRSRGDLQICWGQ